MSIKARVNGLEQSIKSSAPTEPVVFLSLPDEGHPDRERVEAEIAAQEKAGKKVIAFVRAGERQE